MERALPGSGHEPMYWNSGSQRFVSLDRFSFEVRLRYATSEFVMKASRNPKDWQAMMKVLAKFDVSRLRRMHLVLPNSVTESGLKVFGMDHLRTVLGTGRFSALESLTITTDDTMHSASLGQEDRASLAAFLRADPPTDPQERYLHSYLAGILGTDGSIASSFMSKGVRVGLDKAGSESLAALLRTGQLTNLQELHLPPCDPPTILGALNDGSISKLVSFSIIDGRPGLDEMCQRNFGQKLVAVLKGGCFKYLQSLDLSNGVVDGLNGWETFIRAVNSGMVPNIATLRLSQSALHLANLADLVPLLLLNPLKGLTMDGCWINSDQICGMANAIANSGPQTILALTHLDLHDNMLDSRAVGAIVDLAESDQLPHLGFLDLSMNKGIDWRALVSLTETIERGHLPSMEVLK